MPAREFFFTPGSLGVPTGVWASAVLLSGAAIVMLATRLRRERRRVRALSTQIELLSQRRRVIFDFLHDLGEAFTEGISVDELLRMIATFSVQTTQASAGAVFLLDQDKAHLQAEVVIGPFPPPLRAPELEGKANIPPRQLEQIVRSQTIPMGEGLIGEVAQSGKPVLIQDGLKDPRLVQHEDPALQTRTAIFIPLKFKDEVLGVMAVVNKQPGEFAPFFNANDLFLLDSLADHAAISLYNTTLYTLEAEQKQLDSDLRVASDIQRMLLPDRAPVLRNFQITGRNVPAQRVGGDYYDFLPLGETHLGVVIADVSGKAIPGALIMTLCRSAFRAQTGFLPAEVLRRVNQALLPDLREDMFVTILYGILDANDRSFRLVRAGHDPALWYRAQTGQVEIVRPRGVAVGLARAEEFAARLEERQLELAPGDIVVLYTDGITESVNTADTEFGREQLMEAIRENAAGSAEQIAQAVFDRLRIFTGDAPPADDRTLIVIKAT